MITRATAVIESRGHPRRPGPGGGGRPHDLPLGAPDTAADAARARREIESRDRDRAAGDASRPDPTRRPDLDHDVTQGIQSQNLERGLGR